jgi:hypothetical protein
VLVIQEHLSYATCTQLIFNACCQLLPDSKHLQRFRHGSNVLAMLRMAERQTTAQVASCCIP